MSYDTEFPVCAIDEPTAASAAAAAVHVFGTGADSDGDGISDSAEQSSTPGLLDFSAFGADPGVPDLFVQADWIACDPIVEYCGPNNTFDQHRMSGPAAERLADYFAPDVHLHVDNGVPGDGPERSHGAWSGAHRVAPDETACNPDTLGQRYGAFHRVLTFPLGSGGNANLFGFCSTGDGVRMGVLAQELGHNFGINHGGNPDSYPANCKPHYRSPMNYAYTYNDGITQFSRGAFADLPLNPTHMDEEFGLGTADPDVLDGLRSSAFRYLVRDDGAIDWNRNGRIDTAPVRAAVTWGWSSCEQSTTGTVFMLGPVSEPALAWLPDDQTPRLYLVQRHRDQGTLETHYATRLDQCDVRMADGCTNFQPEPGKRGTAIPGAPDGEGSPAVAGYVDRTGQARLMVATTDRDGQLVALALALAQDTEVWTEPSPVPAPASNARVARSPAMVATADRLILLALFDTGELYRSDYDLASERFGQSAAQYWDDGTPIMSSCAGLAMVQGYEAGLVGPQTYLAIPTGPTCTLEIARLDAVSGAWVRRGESAWVSSAPMVGGRPGLAYVPFDPAVPQDGRFYVAWRPFPAGAGRLAMSQGNDPDPSATERRFAFESGVFIRNVWGVVMDGLALVYDPRFDDNLRISWAYRDYRVQFHPFADGIIDVDMYDQDDYRFILQYLACSLIGSCSQ